MANGGISMWGAGQLLGEFFGRRIDYPSSFFVALARNNPPGPFTEGGELDEPPVEFGYLRAEVTNEIFSWNLSDEVITNANDIVFPAATDGWGTIRYYAVCNTDLRGSLYFYGDFGEAQIGEAADVFTIPSGTLSIALGPIYLGVSFGD